MRERIVARPFGVLAVAVLAALLSGCAVGSSQAACAAPMPTIEVSPQQAVPGEPITPRGDGFIGRFSCDDTGPDVFEDDATRAHGARDIRLEYRQGGKTWKLGTVDAGRKLGFETRVEVPADARSGPATLRAVGGGTAETTLRVIKAPDPVTPAPPTSASATSVSEPPPATLSFGERTEKGELGSYCSADGCMDVAGFPVPAEKKELAVPAGSGARLDLGNLQPFSVKVGAAPLDGKDAKLLRAPNGSRELVPRGNRMWPGMRALKTRRVQEQELLDLDLPPGKYALEVFVWFPQGDASYYFRVEVEPETAGEGRGQTRPGVIVCYA